jgi:hypothetical protein
LIVSLCSFPEDGDSRPEAGDLGEQGTQTAGAAETGPWILEVGEGGRVMVIKGVERVEGRGENFVSERIKVLSLVESCCSLFSLLWWLLCEREREREHRSLFIAHLA